MSAAASDLERIGFENVIEILRQVGGTAVGDVEEFHALACEGVAIEEVDEFHHAPHVAAIILDDQQIGRGIEGMGGALAEKWRPWRAYAVLHLWNSLSKKS